MTQLSPHFSLEEFTASDTAQRLGLNNDLPLYLTSAAKATAQMMERIREFLGGPILISSGYRCQELNAAVGSTPASDHRRALACDFRSPAVGTPLHLCRALVPEMDRLGIGQIIYEHSWVHVSTRVPTKVLNRILTVHPGGYSVGIIGD